MKKVFLTTAALALVCVSTYANPGKASGKSDKESKKELRKERREERRMLWLHSADPYTETQFNNDFPFAEDVSWTESAFAEATFKDGDIIKTAFYDDEHNLVGTTTNVDFSVLPEKTKEYIAKKYPGYTVEQVILFDDNEANDTDMIMFGNPFEDEDNYFPVLAKDSKEIILKVAMDGDVSFFHNGK